MNKDSYNEKVNHNIGFFLGALLRIGVWLSSFIAFVGGILFLMEDGLNSTDYRALSPDETFVGVPKNLTNFEGIIEGIINLNGASIIQLGVITLIATPVIRVAVSIFTFAYERDLLYVIITLIVFFIIIANMTLGLH